MPTQEHPKSKRITVKVSVPIWLGVREWAKRENRSAEGQVNHVLRLALQEAGLWPPQEPPTEPLQAAVGRETGVHDLG